MMDKTDRILTGIIWFLVGVFISVCFVLIWNPGEIYYRQGQIDALTGKVEYELKSNPDSTVTWYRKGQ